MSDKFYKRLLLVIAVCLLVIAGSGLMRANAGQDAGAMLENWFNGKRSQSVNEIDAAIKTEKNRLMGELQAELNQSIGGAAKEIEDFTNAEKARRVQALRDYAASLMAGIGQGSADWDKQEYLDEVEKEVQKAIKEIDKAADKAKKMAEKNQPKKIDSAPQPAPANQPDQQTVPENPAESAQPETGAPAKKTEKAPEQPAPPATTEPAENTQPTETSQPTTPAPEAPSADSSAQDASPADESGAE
ncbi:MULTISPECIES: hypothetical protein [Bhargavaea]|uniref:Uncharacterized protein n=1 Tax=Bhargavaea changchunensis TaxID=2134037 RepID=A0ABW2N9J4_9BACL|nr:hypothetical protein [Bhargavaea sp. CC-171006]